MTCYLRATYIMGFGPGGQPQTATTRDAFAYRSRALDEAKKLFTTEERRQQKDARQGPALADLVLEEEDGSIVGKPALRREAFGIHD